ncbi:MAG: hypothetical protein JRI23_11630 [Deltaproteobacteria bacterium]|nr:hypothetical protein [Deltaproteobacteria bacterium]MBW2532349.1 hypothetical protein [Deltaproteobacteria bacterium]
MAADDRDLDGWTERETYDEPRLSELVATYEELGFEVRMVPFRAEDTEGCTECMKGAGSGLMTIYTRKRSDR